MHLEHQVSSKNEDKTQFIHVSSELFRISVSASLLNEVKREINRGLTLKTYFQRYQKPGSSEFMLLASLIKFYCNSLKEPAFTTKVAKKIIIVEESCIEEAKKLGYYKKIFLTLPTVGFLNYLHFILIV